MADIGNPQPNHLDYAVQVMAAMRDRLGLSRALNADRHRLKVIP